MSKPPHTRAAGTLTLPRRAAASRNAPRNTARQDSKPADGSERLAKRVAALQQCSRGDAERYIEGGWVAVDGKTVEEPGFRVARNRLSRCCPAPGWNPRSPSPSCCTSPPACTPTTNPARRAT